MNSMKNLLLVALFTSFSATASEKVLITCVEPSLNVAVTVTQDPSGTNSFKVTEDGVDFRSLTSKNIVISPSTLDRNSGKLVYRVRRQKIIDLTVALPLQPIAGSKAQASTGHLDVNSMNGKNLRADMSCLVFPIEER